MQAPLAAGRAAPARAAVRARSAPGSGSSVSVAPAPAAAAAATTPVPATPPHAGSAPASGSAGAPAGGEAAPALVKCVVFATSEVAPWSKTGGLGDVVGSLPFALAKQGLRVMVRVRPCFSRLERFAVADCSFCAASKAR